jgi:hypothetical protein
MTLHGGPQDCILHITMPDGSGWQGRHAAKTG